MSLLIMISDWKSAKDTKKCEMLLFGTNSLKLGNFKKIEP